MPVDTDGRGDECRRPESRSDQGGVTGPYSFHPSPQGGRGQAQYDGRSRKDGYDGCLRPIGGGLGNDTLGRGQARREHAVRVDAADTQVDQVGWWNIAPTVGDGGVERRCCGLFTKGPLFGGGRTSGRTIIRTMVVGRM